jgi:hypothetical protein
MLVFLIYYTNVNAEIHITQSVIRMAEGLDEQSIYVRSDFLASLHPDWFRSPPTLLHNV